MSSIETAIAANRFGLGARPGDLAEIGDDPKGWLRAQAAAAAPMPSEIAALPRSAQILTEFAAFQDRRRVMREQEKSSSSGEAAAAKKGLAKVKLSLAPMFRDQIATRIKIAVRSERSFSERLVHFWTNHFATSADKPPMLALAGALENEAIRPHVNGRFVDMLLAVEKHPGMLLYLENHLSIGPNSAFAAAKGGNGRNIGINENLGREILELHTLGVNGGYTQADVTTFAQAITGWSVGGGRGRLEGGPAGEFYFRDALHEPGAKTILGKRYPDGGLAQGEAVLKMLARHPSTARYIAFKLAQHFIADEPGERAVSVIARAFIDNDGDLPSVYAALIDAPEAWSEPFQKFKTPNDYIISAFRAYGSLGKKTQPQRLLKELGQRPYTPGSPAGWPDTTRDWDGGSALLKRIEVAVAAGKRIGNRRDPVHVADAVLGATLSEQTRTEIVRAASAAQGHALLLVCPEFQRR